MWCSSITHPYSLKIDFEEFSGKISQNNGICSIANENDVLMARIRMQISY